jgi:hypothetical protein
MDVTLTTLSLRIDLYGPKTFCKAIGAVVFSLNNEAKFRGFTEVQVR